MVMNDDGRNAINKTIKEAEREKTVLINKKKRVEKLIEEVDKTLKGLREALDE